VLAHSKLTDARLSLFEAELVRISVTSYLPGAGGTKLNLSGDDPGIGEGASCSGVGSVW